MPASGEERGGEGCLFLVPGSGLWVPADGCVGVFCDDYCIKSGSSEEAPYKPDLCWGGGAGGVHHNSCTPLGSASCPVKTSKEPP